MPSKKKVIKINKRKTSSKKTFGKTKKNIKYPSYSATEIRKLELQHVIQELTDLQKGGKLQFPYKNLLMTQQEIKDRFNRLKKYKYKVIATKYRHRNKFNLPPHFLNYKGKPLLLPFKASNYENYDLISDYFQEEARMKCLRFREQHTPYQYFENELPNIIKKAHSQYGKVNAHSMREAIFQLSNECSSFRPTVIVSVIQMFKSKCLLDISSGWGDRLIGAMAADVDFYFGCDPNPDLHAGYQEMIRFFGKDKKKFQIEESPFEKANIPDKPYDLIMTSPPYFDIEIYRPDDPRQSVYQKNLQSWLHSFMFVALKKAWSKLIVGGYLVLNINNKGNKDRMVEPIIYFMNKMSNADYYGCISYGEFKGENVRNPQPMWIWRKTHKDLKRKRMVGGSSNKSKRSTSQSKRNSKRSSKKKSVPRKGVSRKSVSTVNYNPPFIVRPAYISKEDNTESATKSIKINVLRDDLLEAGTKQRAMIPYLANHKSTEFVYVSPFTGSAQITLSYASLITGKKVTVYMDKRRPRHPLTVKALSYGVLNLVEVPNGNFKKLNKMAQDYVDLVKKEKGEDYITLFSLGFTNDEYINLLAKQIKEALPQEMRDNPPERFWVPTGSTAMVNALYKVLPTTHFFVVQTGKTVWDDQLDLTRTTIYRSEEFFYHHAKEQPPFPTTKAYDAKAWTFVKRFAKDEDYLINITRDPDLKKLRSNKKQHVTIKRNGSKKKLSRKIDTSKKRKILEAKLINFNDDGSIVIPKYTPQYKTFKNKNYHFEYSQIRSLIDSNPKIEYLRHIKWSKIVDDCLSFLKEKKIVLSSGKKSQHQILSDNLAMWISRNLMEHHLLVDPLIPYNAQHHDTFIKTLSYLGKINVKQAEKLYDEMNLVSKCNTAVEELALIHNINLHSLGKKAHHYTLKKGKGFYHYSEEEPVQINFKLPFMEKVTTHLIKRFRKNEKLKRKKPASIGKIESIIFCTLLRYQSLMGNSHQFAMGVAFKEALRREYQVYFECFASAINCHYPMFGSLFYDIEKYFGSYGNFYLLKFHRGFFIANPPYETELLLLMVNKFINSVKKSKEPLSISYGLPNWGEYERFEPLEITKESKEVKFSRCMKPGEVFWYDRLNDIRIKIPSHCRSVAQNEAAKEIHDLSKFDDLVNKYWVDNRRHFRKSKKKNTSSKNTSSKKKYSKI